MPRLPVLTANKVIKILKRRGFALDHASGSHFIFYHIKGRRRVTVPRHPKDLPKGTLLEILRQAGISKEELVGLLGRWV